MKLNEPKKLLKSMSDTRDAETHWWRKKYDIKTSVGNLYIRLFENGDENSLLKFSEMIGPESRRLFSPFHWGTDKQLAEYQEAVAKTRDGSDASFLLLDSTATPVALLHLWGVAREHLWYDEVLRIPTLGMCVADEYQGKGLGRVGINFLKEEAQSLKVDAIELTTVPDNDRAIKLYLSIGFKDIGFLNIPLGVDPSTADPLVAAATQWRRERHMVYMVNPKADSTVMKYLLQKQARYAGRTSE